MDEDLLNEGNRRLRDYFQRLGYFDAKVDHQAAIAEQRSQVDIVFNVAARDRAAAWKRSPSTGNHYFDSATLKDLLSVHAAGCLDRHGAYSQALVSGRCERAPDRLPEQRLLQVKVTPETSTPETVVADNPRPPQSVRRPRHRADRAARRHLPHR